jgi:hypothetical protein
MDGTDLRPLGEPGSDALLLRGLLRLLRERIRAEHEETTERLVSDPGPDS